LNPIPKRNHQALQIRARTGRNRGILSCNIDGEASIASAPRICDCNSIRLSSKYFELAIELVRRLEEWCVSALLIE